MVLYLMILGMEPWFYFAKTEKRSTFRLLVKTRYDERCTHVDFREEIRGGEDVVTLTGPPYGIYIMKRLLVDKIHIVGPG
jgi:hypothetical protein